MASSQRFRLAPMDGLNLGLTIFVAAIPILIAAPLPLLFVAAPPFLFSTIGTVAFLVVGLFAGVLIYARPLAFELSADGLLVEWPVRRKQIPLAEIASLELLSWRELRARHGWGARVGAGGFFGGFGWYRTRTQRFHLYVSRIDRVVLVHLRRGDPWLITPESPERFLSSARALLDTPRRADQT